MSGGPQRAGCAGVRPLSKGATRRADQSADKSAHSKKAQRLLHKFDPCSSKLISEKNNSGNSEISNRMRTLGMLDLTRNSYHQNRLTGILLTPKLRQL